MVLGTQPGSAGVIGSSGENFPSCPPHNMLRDWLNNDTCCVRCGHREPLAANPHLAGALHNLRAARDWRPPVASGVRSGARLSNPQVMALLEILDTSSGIAPSERP